MLLRNREEAEDAVQQTFLAAYRSLLNGIEPRHPAAWLATIARNVCWGRIRQRMREPLSEPEPESTLPDPIAAAAARADLAALWRAIGELPAQQREALLLREFSGLSYAELAQALAVSEPAVESLLFRARRGLRLRLRPAQGLASSIAPLAAIREAVARAIGGMPDPATTGALAKLASVPLAAKLAAGTAAAVVAGGAVVEIDWGPRAREPAASAAAAKVQPRTTVTRGETPAETAGRWAARPSRAARLVRVGDPRTPPSPAPAVAPKSRPAASTGKPSAPTVTTAGDSAEGAALPASPSLAPDALNPALPPAPPDDDRASAADEGDDSGSLRSDGESGSDGEDEDTGSGSSSNSGPGSESDSGEGEYEDSGSSGSTSSGSEESGEGGEDEGDSSGESADSGGGGESDSGSGSGESGDSSQSASGSGDDADDDPEDD